MNTTLPFPSLSFFTQPLPSIPPPLLDHYSLTHPLTSFYRPFISLFKPLPSICQSLNTSFSNPSTSLSLYSPSFFFPIPASHILLSHTFHYSTSFPPDSSNISHPCFSLSHPSTCLSHPCPTHIPLPASLIPIPRGPS